MTHDEETPRIVARGEWYQDEYGDTTYVPAHIRPSYLDDLEAERRQQEEDEADSTLDQPAPLGVWANPPEPCLKNTRTDDTWEAIRTDYLAGDPAQLVADRYGVGLSTLRLRAAREGWRRRDQPAPDPFILDEDAPAPDLDTLAKHALARMDHAIKKGRAAEAASWMRTWRALTAPEAAAPPPPKTEHRIDAIARLTREAETLAKQAMANIDHLTPADRTRIDARLTAILAELGQT